MHVDNFGYNRISYTFAGNTIFASENSAGELFAFRGISGGDVVSITAGGNITAQGALTCGAITASGTVLPASSGSQALGSTSAYWGTLHLTTLKSAGVINVNTNGTGYGAFAFGYTGYLNADQLIIRSNNQVSTRLVVSSSSITSTIPLAWTPQQSSLDPTTIDIPSGRRVSWYNSTLA